jgi:hypothetical protein
MTLEALRQTIMDGFHACGFSVNVYTTAQHKSTYVRSLLRPQRKTMTIARTLVIGITYRDEEIATCRGILSTERSENVLGIPDQEVLSFSIDWIGVHTSYRRRNIAILLLNLMMINVLLYKRDVVVFTLEDETDKPNAEDNIYVKTGFQRFLSLDGAERFKLTRDYIREVEEGRILPKIESYFEKLKAKHQCLRKSKSAKPIKSKSAKSKSVKSKSKSTKLRTIRIRSLR